MLLFYGARTPDLFVYGRSPRRAREVPSLTCSLVCEETDGRLQVDAAWPAIAPLRRPGLLPERPAADARRAHRAAARARRPAGRHPHRCLGVASWSARSWRGELMRILLTGGSGFIGRNLVEYLSRSHEVLAPTHAELDLADPDALDAWFAEHEVDVVVHGAVRPGHRNASDPSRQLWTNLRMFFGLMRNAHRFGRLVFLSSGAVYDIARPLDRVAEDAARRVAAVRRARAVQVRDRPVPGAGAPHRRRRRRRAAPLRRVRQVRGLRHPLRVQRDLQEPRSTCRSPCARTARSATST